MRNNSHQLNLDLIMELLYLYCDSLTKKSLKLICSSFYYRTRQSTKSVSVDGFSYSSVSQQKQSTFYKGNELISNRLDESDKIASALGKFYSLQEISFFACPASISNCVQEITAKHQSLKSLVFNNANGLNNIALAGIAQLSNLRQLELSFCSGFDTKAYEHIGKMTNLRELSLYCLKSTKYGAFSNLTNLKNLEILYISTMVVDGEDFVSMAGNFPKLKNLSIIDVGGINKEQILQLIEGLPGLEKLYITLNDIMISEEEIMNINPDIDAQMMYQYTII